MTNVTTQISITAKDSTAAAFASADQNLSGLSSTALKVTGALAAVGVSVAGVVSAVKGVADATIQFQQFTNTLQVGTGSAKGAADALSFVRVADNPSNIFTGVILIASENSLPNWSEPEIK